MQLPEGLFGEQDNIQLMTGYPFPKPVAETHSDRFGGPRGSAILGPMATARPVRQGALYGAVEALQVAQRAAAGIVDQTPILGTDVEDMFLHQKRASSTLSPEEAWQSIPTGGEISWKATQTRQSHRLRVARVQEALSDAATGLQRASEACQGIGSDALLESLGVNSLGPPSSAMKLHNDCVALEAEANELEEEKNFLDGRIVEVKEELARVKNSLQPPVKEMARGSLVDDSNVSELAVVLKLLACLKDVALTNRALILPSDPSQWTQEQQVVAYFLDEVEACQQILEQ